MQLHWGGTFIMSHKQHAWVCGQGEKNECAFDKEEALEGSISMWESWLSHIVISTETSNVDIYQPIFWELAVADYGQVSDKLTLGVY